jgi:hypothetical protein
LDNSEKKSPVDWIEQFVALFDVTNHVEKFQAEGMDQEDEDPTTATRTKRKFEGPTEPEREPKQIRI